MNHEVGGVMFMPETPSTSLTTWASLLITFTSLLFATGTFFLGRANKKGSDTTRFEEVERKAEASILAIDVANKRLDAHDILHVGYVRMQQDLSGLDRKTEGVRDCLIRIATKLNVEGPK